MYTIYIAYCTQFHVTWHAKTWGSGKILQFTMFIFMYMHTDIKTLFF